jgi:hypothetical protein
MVLTKQSLGLIRVSTAVLTLALLLTSATSGCAFPEEAFDGSLEGSYYVNGFDQQDVEYSGLLTITATDDPAIYEMQWIITGSVQEGTGEVVGNELRVAWEAIEGFDTASQGSAIYLINANGELDGERSVDGQEGIGTEEAFPIR